MRTATSLLLALLLLLLLAPVVEGEQVDVDPRMYKIRVDTRDLGPGIYGFIILLRDNLYTAFVVLEDGTYRCAHEAEYLFFPQAAAEILPIDISKRLPVCTSTKDGIVGRWRPERDEAYVVRIVESMVLRNDPSTVRITVEEIRQAAGGSGAPGVLEALFGFFRTVGDSLRVLMAALSHAGAAFEALLSGFSTLGSWIGSPGEVEALYYYNMYRAELSVLSASYDVRGTVVEDVLECRRPIRDSLHLMTSQPSAYVDLTLCELEGRQPRGMIGMLQVAFSTLTALGPVAEFIAQNFVLLNVGVVAVILMDGIYRSLRDRDFGAFTKSIERIYKIFEFYWRIVRFVAELIWKIISMIAEFVEAVNPL